MKEGEKGGNDCLLPIATSRFREIKTRERTSRTVETVETHREFACYYERRDLCGFAFLLRSVFSADPVLQGQWRKTSRPSTAFASSFPGTSSLPAAVECVSCRRETSLVRAQFYEIIRCPGKIRCSPANDNVPERDGPSRSVKFQVFLRDCAAR